MRIAIALLAASLFITAHSQTVSENRLPVADASVASLKLKNIAGPEDLEYETLSAKEYAGKVLETIRLKDGRVMNVLKSGQVSRDEVKDVLFLNMQKAQPDANVTFFESFEGWDEKDYDWVPDGWADVSAAGNVPQLEYGVNETWYCSKSLFNPAPDGKYIMWLNMSYEHDVEIDGETVHIPKVYQDEWLMTPVITPTSTSRLVFDLHYCPNYIINEDPLEGENPFQANFQVLVTEDDGENWDIVWDAYDTVIAMSEDEFNDGSMVISAKWYNYSVDVSKYAGKNVKFAFRYYGNGDSMGLDAVTLRDPQPAAYYDIPEGVLNWTYGENLAYFSQGIHLLAPAYTPLEWRNESNDEAYTFSWEFADGEGGTIVKEDRNPSVSYPETVTQLPVLTGFSNVGDFASEYSMDNSGYGEIYYGGTTSYGGVKMSAGNYVPQNGLAVGPLGNDKYFFGVGADEMLSGWHLKGVSNLYEKPAHPYLIDRVWVLCVDPVPADSDASVELTVYEMENGRPGDVIATSVCKYSDFVLRQDDQVNQLQLYSVPFEFEKQLVIDSEIMLTVRGFNDGEFETIGFCYQYNDHDFGKNFVYLNVVPAGSASSPETIYPLTRVLENKTSMYFNLDVTMPYVHAESDALEFGWDGGTRTVVLDSYFPMEELSFNNLPSWIKRSEPYVEGDKVKVDLIVEALPEGRTIRTAQLNISAPACSESVTVRQTVDASVDGIDKDDDVLFRRSGDKWMFEIDGFGYRYVRIYDSIGRLVVEDSVYGTECVVDASVLQNGIYLVQFSGEKSVTLKVSK